jgi:hypothetical protein
MCGWFNLPKGYDLKIVENKSRSWTPMQGHNQTNERYPDFTIGRQGKHSGLRANWMVAEMAALALGTMQLHSFAWSQKLTKYVKDGQLEKAMQLFQQMQ